MSVTGSGIGTVEIVHIGACKCWTAAQKLSIVEESKQPGNSVSRVARQHGVAPAMLYRWRKLMLEGGAITVETNDQVVGWADDRSVRFAFRRNS